MKSFKKRIGERLKGFRELRGFDSQTKFADALGVEQSTVQRWENGTFLPKDEQIEKIESVLGIKDLNKLFEDPHFEIEDFGLDASTGKIVRISDMFVVPDAKKIWAELIDLRMKLEKLEGRVESSEGEGNEEEVELLRIFRLSNPDARANILTHAKAAFRLDQGEALLASRKRRNK